MPLTVIAIKQAQSRNKNYRLYDEKGLYLQVTKAGGKLWRLKYRYQKKEKLLSMGAYPEISLKDARSLRDAARAQLANGVDPSEYKKLKKVTAFSISANTFEVIAREWHLGQSRIWSPIHTKNVNDRLSLNIFPFLGNKLITEITVPELLQVLRRIEARGAFETAHRVLGNVNEVFRFAIASGKADRNIAADLKGALQPVKKKHLAAVTDPKRAGELLRMIDGYVGTLTVRCALRLAPLVFVRPGELRNAFWRDFDLDTAEWRYTVTKTGTEHLVPLSRQALDILNAIYPSTGRSEYVFPSARSRDRPMSNNAVLSAMRRMEIDKEEMSGHGFRAMARTILDEVLGYRPEIIEQQLAHQVRDPLGRAYNRTAYLDERRAMMQRWADYLDGLKSNEQG